MPADSHCERRAGFCERCGYRRCEALSASPARGEGGAPVAWRVESVASPGEAWEWVEGREPTEYAGDPAFVVRRYAPDTSHPTPATPEGLRPFGLSPLEIERIRSRLIEGLEKAYWAGSEVAQGFDATKEADAILAALQPQAEGGSR